MKIEVMHVLSTIRSITIPNRADSNHYVFEVSHNNDRSISCSSIHRLDRSPFGPELSIPNNTEYRTQAGERIELPCGISSVPSNARVTWWKNGVEIVNLPEHSFSHSLILPLSASSANDSGHYVCRIDDDSGGRFFSHMIMKVDGK